MSPQMTARNIDLSLSKKVHFEQPGSQNKTERNSLDRASNQPEFQKIIREQANKIMK